MNSDMTQDYEVLKLYAKVYFYEVKEGFWDPLTHDSQIFHELEAGDWVFQRQHQRNPEIHWQGSYQVFLTIDTETKAQTLLLWL